MWDEVFRPPPEQWGLRGDPYLWDALRDRLGQGRPPESATDARRQLVEAFQALVGVAPNPYLGAEHVRVEAFAHGGTSSGVVDLRTWHDRLVPLLLGRVAERLAEQQPSGAGATGTAVHDQAGVDALLRRFEPGDAVLRRVELDLPAMGRSSARLVLEVQERTGDDWRWTTLTLVVRGLRAFALTEGRTTHQVLTGPPLIAPTADGTWVVDLARGLEEEPSTGRWYDSPHFVLGDELSWHCG